MGQIVASGSVCHIALLSHYLLSSSHGTMNAKSFGMIQAVTGGGPVNSTLPLYVMCFQILRDGLCLYHCHYALVIIFLFTGCNGRAEKMGVLLGGMMP